MGIGSADEIRSGMARVAERTGPWRSHNIHLGHGIHTISEQPVTANYKLRRVMQVASDLLGERFEGLRVLDLACEEGMFGIEFARHGAQVLGVEGRRVHVERARFAQQALDLDNCEFVQGDVRQLRPETHGTFDVVLCLGLLYHLDAPDAMEFIYRARRLTRRFLILQTLVALKPAKRVSFAGISYAGTPVFEHPAKATAEQKMGRLRASLDNVEAFRLTKPSLFNLLLNAGFTSVLEARHPRPALGFTDRVLLAAMAGGSVELHSAPALNEAPTAPWPEREKPHFDQRLSRRAQVKRWLNARGIPIRRYAWRRRS